MVTVTKTQNGLYKVESEFYTLYQQNSWSKEVSYFATQEVEPNDELWFEIEHFLDGEELSEYYFACDNL